MVNKIIIRVRYYQFQTDKKLKEEALQKILRYVSTNKNKIIAISLLEEDDLLRKRLLNELKTAALTIEDYSLFVKTNPSLSCLRVVARQLIGCRASITSLEEVKNKVDLSLLPDVAEFLANRLRLIRSKSLVDRFSHETLCLPSNKSVMSSEERKKF